jgi:hypothetical protein
MKPIQHVQSLTNLGRDDSQVGFPHVTTHKTQSFDDLRPQCLEAPFQCRLRAPTTYPQQASALPVDLVDDGQEIVRLQAVAPMNLVHPDRLYHAQFAVRQAVLHKPVHRTIHRLPTGLEGARGF